MFKAYKYECKHYLMDKVFLILAVITVFYCRFILTSEIILGIANTAPFSPWSFGSYMGMLLPFACACLLSLFAITYSRDQRLAEQITAATPMSRFKRMIQRLSAIYTGFVLLVLLALLLAVWFYFSVFGSAELLQLLAPLAYSVLPALLVVTGFAMQLGRFGNGGIYVLLVLLLLYGFFAGDASLPLPLDLFGSSFFRHSPQIINGLDPDFSIPISALMSRLVLSAVGVGCILLSESGWKTHS